MAACVDKWHPMHPGRLSSAIYRFLPDCTTDRLVAAASAGAAASGSGGNCCVSGDDVWDELRAEAQADADAEPVLRKFYADLVLSRPSLEAALAEHLAAKLCVTGALPQDALRDLLAGALAAHPEAGCAARADLLAARDRDPACNSMVHCFLYYKGFLALQAHRAAHGLWSDGRAAAALLLQSRASEVFGVDIHPGACIGCGILFDHATGIVIGETAVIGNDVSILHGVTLGGTGKDSGDRHPKVGDGVLIGAGASVLGNVHIGTGAKIGAGAVVLRDVPEGTTAVGNPAKEIGKKAAPQRRPDEQPGVTMEQRWLDYVN
ncbi:probable serine acetyltransferase 4 [Phragmites australis]|uniref:probable serine acetyltransferase 4 n=1 Tax=Phragmites australis TaxID=29695 RepID=UPI002D79A2B7|nr:probable serine acetyltransferase 4 [Phragmites australis]